MGQETNASTVGLKVRRIVRVLDLSLADQELAGIEVLIEQCVEEGN